jgi:flagellar hook-associated protein 3 FlgL
MIGGRVTEKSIHTRVLSNLQRNLSQSAKLQEQLSSGKQISRPSDSPAGTVSALQLRSETRASQQYIRNADDGLNWLGTMQDTLSGTSALFNKARELTLQGSGGNINGGLAQEALAAEIDQIRETMIAQANTRYLDRPIFGGNTAGEVAYDKSGSYKGTSYDPNSPSTTSVSRSVGSGIKVRVDVTGAETFGDDATGMFQVLKDISAGIRGGDSTQLAANLKLLDKAGDRMKSAVSEIGSRYNRMTQMKESAENRMLSVSSQLSDIEDIDLPKTIMDMQLQETSYQAALAATAKVIQPSLLDYLR